MGNDSTIYEVMNIPIVKSYDANSKGDKRMDLCFHAYAMAYRAFNRHHLDAKREPLRDWKSWVSLTNEVNSSRLSNEVGG